MVNRPNFEKAHLDQFWTWIVEQIDSFGKRLDKLEKANPGTKPRSRAKPKPKKK